MAAPNPTSPVGVGSSGWPTANNAGQAPRKQSDPRWRSFCERYFVARAGFFRQDPNGLAEDTWTCILDAKRVYAMIKRTGENIEPDGLD